MPSRNVDVNGNIQIRFANGSYIETPVRSLEVEFPYEVRSASDYMTSIGASSGSFSADVGLKDLDKLIAKINEYIEPQKETEPAISFEETMGFNT